jgi:hypothetical protein
MLPLWTGDQLSVDRNLSDMHTVCVICRVDTVSASYNDVPGSDHSLRTRRRARFYHGCSQSFQTCDGYLIPPLYFSFHPRWEVRVLQHWKLACRLLSYDRFYIGGYQCLRETCVTVLYPEDVGIIFPYKTAQEMFSSVSTHIFMGLSPWEANSCLAKLKTLWLLVRKRTIPTERPPLVGEVSANFCG